MGRKSTLLFLVTLSCVILLPQLVVAQSSFPAITINTSGGSDNAHSEVFAGLKLVSLLTALIFIPSLLMTVTCFTRLAIVLALVRQALGLAQTPPNQVIVGLALFLTCAIMGPIFEEIYNTSLIPYTEDKIEQREALEKAFKPLKGFMLRHTREQDLALFIEVRHEQPTESPEQLGALTIIPAFVISELNTAFQIGFLIFLPFLILDMVVSSVLTSMSMITLPPTIISLPLKLMLFVVIDGWHLVIENLVRSYSI